MPSEFGKCYIRDIVLMTIAKRREVDLQQSFINQISAIIRMNAYVNARVMGAKSIKPTDLWLVGNETDKKEEAKNRIPQWEDDGKPEMMKPEDWKAQKVIMEGMYKKGLISKPKFIKLRDGD